MAKSEVDIGIVWTTEVAYAIGPMLSGRNMKYSKRFMSYLATQEAQKIYSGYGFVPATSAELELKPLSAK